MRHPPTAKGTCSLNYIIVDFKIQYVSKRNRLQEQAVPGSFLSFSFFLLFMTVKDTNPFSVKNKKSLLNFVIKLFYLLPVKAGLTLKYLKAQLSDRLITSPSHTARAASLCGSNNMAPHSSRGASSIKSCIKDSLFMLHPLCRHNGSWYINSGFCQHFFKKGTICCGQTKRIWQVRYSKGENAVTLSKWLYGLFYP